MSELLPVVQKAQPHYIGASGDLYPSKVSNDNWIDYVYKEKDIERERAGYEKREQTLKNKIKKIVEQLENSESRFFEMKEQLGNLQLHSVEQLRYDEGRDALRKSIEELLGLSKQ